MKACQSDQTLILQPDLGSQFWKDYRAVFGDVRTTFTHATLGRVSVALEWISTGSLRNGKAFRYSGVSVLEGEGE
jgi:hypothetical protein